jgi:hypothetical protein
MVHFLEFMAILCQLLSSDISSLPSSEIPLANTDSDRERIRGWLLKGKWKVFDVTPKDETPWIIRTSFAFPSVWIHPIVGQEAFVFRCRYDMDEAAKRLWDGSEPQVRHYIASEVRIQLANFSSEFELAEECSAITVYERLYLDAFKSGAGQDLFWQRLRRTRNALLGAMFTLAKHLNVSDLGEGQAVN